ncbi:polyphosphate kinase 1 [Pseudoflavonifractor phocaeensis]|uniref:polyphosphate kinase 1 n=1 Tax=Pseudoflavonifractor phocaeensis TaxID=1870988 RepID=UPI00195BD48D|nr:polyphosphate kinase 1 [Pseudoflavonifractor phocaeensis]MBM6926482.1 polyphosphate kinase 1 [Pseudoflavonifractor phocaeensis]
MSKEIDTRYTQERELSWLRFNERVLEEAQDESVPLFERLKFAAIFTSNLDEFFMIRVGSISDMTLSKQTHVDSKSGLTPNQQLQAIFKVVPGLYKQKDKIVSQLEKRLRTCNICNLSPSELDGKERKQVERWFRDYVTPVLSPMVVDSHHPFPHLPSNSLTIALTLKLGSNRCFGLVPIPKALPPYLQLEERGLRYLLTEQVVLTYADKLFEQYQVEEKCVITVTRNADISPEDEDYDVGEDFRAHMQKVLKKRARLAPVRLEIQGEASAELQQYLCQRLNLTNEQVFRCKSPLIMNYVYSLESKLPQESATALCYPPYTPQWPAGLVKGEKLIPQILRQDALLFYPYHTMEPFLQLVREAANDPAVLSIKITIYRLASTAKLVEYLAAAAENGKDVTVLMELRARFDEQNNIAWAQRLEEAGCTILYGFDYFKVHSKICLITRQERGRIQYITQIGTGNYNEKTAKLYTDFCLMTASPAIGADGAAFFQNMSTSNLHGEYQQLLVAPYGLKNKVLNLIDSEIEKARQGKPASIFFKVNSVTDRELIDKLAQASQAGVPVTLNVRGICCLRPGVPGLTDHIRVFSIVGRYLEHPRIYAFGTGEDARLYIGSADLMTRNTERRVEIACPVLDPQVRRQIWSYITCFQDDNVKAREMNPDGSYSPVNRADGAPSLNAQATLMDRALQEALQTASAPPLPEKRPGFFRRLFHREHG